MAYKTKTNPMASPAQERGPKRTVHSRQCGASVLRNAGTEQEYSRTVSDSMLANLLHSTAPTVCVLHVGIKYQAAGSPRSSDKASGCPGPAWPAQRLRGCMSSADLSPVQSTPTSRERPLRAHSLEIQPYRQT